MITERLMMPGDFSLTLKPTTPKSVRDVLVPFGHIVVLDAPADVRPLVDADLLAHAIYIGVLRRRPTVFELAGAHVTLWLGDEEGKGDLFEANLTMTALTFVQAVTAALPAHGAIVAGTLTAIAGTITQTFFIANNMGSPRAILDFLMNHFGGEYRVRGDATNKVVLDAGPSSALFNTTPTVVVTPLTGSRDNNIVGLPSSALGLETDGDSFTTRIWLAGASSSNAQANAPSNPYLDLRGNAAWLTRLISQPSTAAANVQAQANAAALQYPLRQAVTLASDRYDIPADMKVGDWLYVYDPLQDLVDTSKEVHYRGETTWPAVLRVYAMSWPVERGMSVYYRDLNAAYTDLTPWIEPEPPGTTFEVGAPVRGLTV